MYLYLSNCKNVYACKCTRMHMKYNSKLMLPSLAFTYNGDMLIAAVAIPAYIVGCSTILSLLSIFLVCFNVGLYLARHCGKATDKEITTTVLIHLSVVHLLCCYCMKV